MLSCTEGLCTLPIVFIMLTKWKETTLGGAAWEREAVMLVSPTALYTLVHQPCHLTRQDNFSHSVF